MRGAPECEVTHPCQPLSTTGDASWEERSGEAARLRPAQPSSAQRWRREKQTGCQQVLALPHSLSPSLQQVGAFSWRDSSPQWGVRASDPRRLAACARKPGTRVGRQGSPESLCPSNNLARALDERGLHLSLSNPQLLQRVSQSPGGLRNRNEFWGHPRPF